MARTGKKASLKERQKISWWILLVPGTSIYINMKTMIIQYTAILVLALLAFSLISLVNG